MSYIFSAESQEQHGRVGQNLKTEVKQMCWFYICSYKKQETPDQVNYTNYTDMLTSGYACLYNYRWKGGEVGRSDVSWSHKLW